MPKEKSASARGRASKNKGKRGELEVAKLLADYGFTGRRGQQFAGGNDSPDVRSDLEGFHIEVKRTETINVYVAMAQAMEDRKPGEIPLVFHRRNSKPWLVVMHADDLLRLLNQYVFE
jgi:Holliday junction resolvase